MFKAAKLQGSQHTTMTLKKKQSTNKPTKKARTTKKEKVNQFSQRKRVHSTKTRISRHPRHISTIWQHKTHTRITTDSIPVQKRTQHKQPKSEKQHRHHTHRDVEHRPQDTTQSALDRVQQCAKHIVAPTRPPMHSNAHTGIDGNGDWEGAFFTYDGRLLRQADQHELGVKL